MEHHAVRDGLAGVGQVLAHEGVVEAELVGEDDGRAILLQRLGPVPVHRVNRHGEVAQSHSVVSDFATARQAHGPPPKGGSCGLKCRLGTSNNLQGRGAPNVERRRLKSGGRTAPVSEHQPARRPDFERRPRRRRDAFTGPPAP